MPPHDESPEPVRPDLPGARPREQGLWVQWWQARRCTHHNELGITFPGTVSCSSKAGVATRALAPRVPGFGPAHPLTRVASCPGAVCVCAVGCGSTGHMA